MERKMTYNFFVTPIVDMDMETAQIVKAKIDECRSAAGISDLKKEINAARAAKAFLSDDDSKRLVKKPVYTEGKKLNGYLVFLKAVEEEINDLLQR